MDVCGPRLSRWKTLTITGFIPSGWDDGEGMVAPDVELVLKSLHRGVRLSRLQELHIEGGHSKPSAFPLSWASPNLQLLQCAHYLPMPSSVFSSVSTFYFTQELSGQLRSPDPKVDGVPDVNSKYFQLRVRITRHWLQFEKATAVSRRRGAPPSRRFIFDYAGLGCITSLQKSRNEPACGLSRHFLMHCICLAWRISRFPLRSY